MTNVFDAVESNTRKSYFIILVFILFITLVVYFLAQIFGGASSTAAFAMGMGISLAMSIGSYWFSDKIVLSMSNAKEANRKKHFNFYTSTQNLCLAAGLPMPKLYVIEDTALNAFATGRNPQNAVVCATTGLINSLSKTELEGVIAHELGHIANRDILLMTIVSVMVGSLTMVADILLRSSIFGGSDSSDRKGGAAIITFVIGIALAMLSPFIAQLIQLSISRRREFLADAYSAKLTRQPSGLISALQKLDKDTEPLEAANKATAHMYISNPLKNHHDSIGMFANLFSTHPPIKDRVNALKLMS